MKAKAWRWESPVCVWGKLAQFSRGRGEPSGVERGKATSGRALNARLRLEKSLVGCKVPWVGGKVTCWKGYSRDGSCTSGGGRG